MGKDSGEIRRAIEQTRARMGDTVEALGYKADVPSRVKDAVHDRVDTVKGTIGGVVDGVKDALGGAKHAVTHTVGDVADTVTDGVGGIAGKIPNGADVQNAARRGVGIAAENPLGLALGALAVGFLAGLLAPVTDYEREKVGPIRDDLLERAQTVGSDVIEHGKQVLQETVQSAVHTAQQSAQTHSQQVVAEAASATSSQYGVMLDEEAAT